MPLSNIDTIDECAICQEPRSLESGPVWHLEPPCGHEFHQACLVQLLNHDRNALCPLCRQPISRIDIDGIFGRGPSTPPREGGRGARGRRNNLSSRPAASVRGRGGDEVGSGIEAQFAQWSPFQGGFSSDGFREAGRGGSLSPPMIVRRHGRPQNMPRDSSSRDISARNYSPRSPPSPIIRRHGRPRDIQPRDSSPRHSSSRDIYFSPRHGSARDMSPRTIDVSPQRQNPNNHHHTQHNPIRSPSHHSHHYTPPRPTHASRAWYLALSQARSQAIHNLHYHSDPSPSSDEEIIQAIGLMDTLFDGLAILDQRYGCWPCRHRLLDAFETIADNEGGEIDVDGVLVEWGVRGEGFEGSGYRDGVGAGDDYRDDDYEGGNVVYREGTRAGSIRADPHQGEGERYQNTERGSQYPQSQDNHVYRDQDPNRDRSQQSHRALDLRRGDATETPTRPGIQTHSTTMSVSRNSEVAEPGIEEDFARAMTLSQQTAREEEEEMARRAVHEAMALSEQTAREEEEEMIRRAVHEATTLSERTAMNEEEEMVRMAVYESLRGR